MSNSRRTVKAAKPKSDLLERSSESSAVQKKVELKLVEGSRPKSEKIEKPDRKKVSEKLMETIEKRKQAKAGAGAGTPKMFQKPPGRRGRRPKAALSDYNPENREEDAYVLEPEYESIEYDTGIRVKNAADDSAFNVERFENYDEELNFDW